MTHSVTDSTQEREHFRRALLPSKMELIVLPILSFLFLVLINSTTYLRSVDGTEYTLAIEYTQVRFKEALKFADQQISSMILTVVLWMFIGVVVYVLLWFAISSYKAYKDDMTPTKGMVLPRGYRSSSVIHEAIARICLRVIAGVLLMFWVYMLFAEMLPYASSMLLEGMMSFSLLSVLRVIWAVIILTGSVFIVFVLARFVVLRERVFSS